MLLSVNTFVSLDGIMQGPGAPDEDHSDGFDRGGWLVPHASAHATEAVEDWKDRPGAELQVHGSWQLVQTLHRAGLVDVYRLLQYPVVVGMGKRLFPEGSTPATFAVVEEGSRVLPGGVVSLTLDPASLGAIAAGAFTVDEGRSATVLD